MVVVCVLVAIKNNLLCAEIDGNIPHNRESESNCTRLEGKVALSKD